MHVSSAETCPISTGIKRPKLSKNDKPLGRRPGTKKIKPIYSNEELKKLPLWTPEHFAQYYGVSIWTILLWRRAGTGPDYIQQNQRVIRYKPSTVIAWINEQETEAHKKAG